MPTYEYRCVSCEHQFERFQRMSDDPVKECEVCGEPVRRLLFPVAIQFKGSGFYTTDYARKTAMAAGGAKADTAGSESTSDSTPDSSNGNGHKAESSPSAVSEAGKPAAAPPATKIAT